MKKVLILSCLIVMSFVSLAFATNGDNLISIGPISRAMGGVGIAAPQDAISAVFSNPAGMCFGPYCPGSEFNFATTIFMPNATTKIVNDAFVQNTGEKKSAADLFIIPAMAVSMPISQNLRFGFAAYGVSGLGVDYRGDFDLNPYTAKKDDVYTNLSILKVAPNIAYMVTPSFSIGASLHIDYGSLNMGDSTKSGFGIGGQVGAIVKHGPLSFGAVMVLPQRIKHKEVADFDQDGSNDDLVLESPMSVGFGIAYEPTPRVFLIEANAKWVNWAGARGYKDFGWDNQWVFGVGAQYRPTPALALRVGYNYGQNPVKPSSGWDGAFSPTVNVQGKEVNRYQYEVLRITGFPAIVETHLTAGIGYQISKKLSVDLGFTHAFKNRIRETGTFMGFKNEASIESSLQENSIDLGITYRF